MEAEVGITGKVTAVDPDAETLTLDLGRETMEVDLSDLTRMPALEAGQRVSVVGESEGVDVFEARALKAKTVTVLSQG